MGMKYSERLGSQIEATLRAESKYRIEVFDTIMEFMLEMKRNGCCAVAFKEAVTGGFTGLRYDLADNVVYIHREGEAWGEEATTVGHADYMVLFAIFGAICREEITEYKEKQI